MEEDNLKEQNPPIQWLSAIADLETVDRRREICNNCEHNKLNVCHKCGCFIPAKIRIKHIDCPANKW